MFKRMNVIVFYIVKLVGTAHDVIKENSVCFVLSIYTVIVKKECLMKLNGFVYVYI